MAAEVLPLIPEICAMGGITLDDFTQRRDYQEIFGFGEATTARVEALLDFRGPSDLTAWLSAHG